MAEPTVEEQERIDTMKAKLGDLPEGASIDFEVMTGDEIIDRMDAEDAAVFLSGDRFFMWKPPGLPILPTVEIHGLDWLEEHVRADGRRQPHMRLVKCRHYGIGNKIGGAEIPLFALFRLSIRGKETPLYIAIDKAPQEWIDQAMRRFVVVWPPGKKDGQRAWIATGKMTRFPEGLVVPAEAGRNSPCPCGSGKKMKRCCAA